MLASLPITVGVLLLRPDAQNPQTFSPRGNVKGGSSTKGINAISSLGHSRLWHSRQPDVSSGLARSLQLQLRGQATFPYNP